MIAPIPSHLELALQRGVARRQAGYRGRFAPSPTGPLHRGNLRTALLSWLEARLQGGEWLLRLDDLDTPRNRPGAAEAIQADLRWLGLHWDGPVVWQSQRRGIYSSVLTSLRRAGLLYPCRCSRRMLADISAPHGQMPVYPGWCRHERHRWGWEQQRLPSWRLRLPPGRLQWQERSGRPGDLDGPTQVGDVVLRRADGFLAYHLATAVDEISLGISDVLRGEDLWDATAAQVAVMAQLGFTPPRYGHLPLWRDQAGQRLGKRHGSLGLAGYQGQGLEAAAVIGALAASVSLVEPGSCLSAQELADGLDLERFQACLKLQVNHPIVARNAAEAPNEAVDCGEAVD